MSTTARVRGSQRVNERILIIDDEPSIHEVVRAYLEREGFIVYSASDGREGLDLALRWLTVEHRPRRNHCP